jgi:hypothetical protein
MPLLDTRFERYAASPPVDIAHRGAKPRPRQRFLARNVGIVCPHRFGHEAIWVED